MRLYCCTPRDCTCTSFVNFPRHAPSGLLSLMGLDGKLVAACVCVCVCVCMIWAEEQACFCLRMKWGARMVPYHTLLFECCILSLQSNSLSGLNGCHWLSKYRHNRHNRYFRHNINRHPLFLLTNEDEREAVQRENCRVCGVEYQDHLLYWGGTCNIHNISALCFK